MVLAAATGITGWHYMIPFNERYAPHLPNYSGSAWGRTFPSAAGFHTSDLFFTDDEGAYYLSTRDGPAFAAPGDDEERFLSFSEDLWRRVKRVSDGRLVLPPQDPHVESHNHWCANRPGSMLVIPIADLAQHTIAALCYLVQNGYGVIDDINKAEIDGLDDYDDLVDLKNLFPLSFLEQQVLGECSVEIGTSCFAGMLQLQAMGLGGWMYDGLNPFSVLGASGDPEVPGLGFRYDTDARWALPNPTGREGVFEAYCPPHFRDMRAAVDAFVERKFGPRGPFHPDTPGPWRDSPEVRGSAEAHDARFRECVGLMAAYIHERFGKFPGTVPSVWVQMYLQAHHLDLDYYDQKFGPGAYLDTHARHMQRWHPEKK